MRPLAIIRSNEGCWAIKNGEIRGQKQIGEALEWLQPVAQQILEIHDLFSEHIEFL